MPGLGATAARRDWRDTLRGATDIALVGILATLAALPLVTAGAAAITASRAVHHWCEHEELPSLRAAGRWFRRAALPGLGALLGFSVAAGALVADVSLLSSGQTPGGVAVLALTIAVFVLLVGIAAIALVRIGQCPDRLWHALTGAVPATGRAWVATVAASGAVGFAAIVAALLPMTIPLLPGVVLLALHAVARRLLPTPATQ